MGLPTVDSEEPENIKFGWVENTIFCCFREFLPGMGDTVYREEHSGHWVHDIEDQGETRFAVLLQNYFVVKPMLTNVTQ